MRNLLQAFALALLVSSQTPVLQIHQAVAQTDPGEVPGDGNLVKSRLGKKRLQEELEKARVEQYRSLPGGVFRAPVIHRQIEAIMRDFQRTRLVDSEAVFEVFLASTPETNAWVSQVQKIEDLRVYHVVVTKGLLDLLSDPETSRKALSEELARAVNEDSLGLLAAVLGHEVGHAMNGDTENEKVTTRMYWEFQADEFSSRLLAEAGYDPEAMIQVLRVFEEAFKDPSLRALIGTMLDEHPKPKFRIANINETVEMLKSVPNARERFGFSSDGSPARKGPLGIRRGGNEKESKLGTNRLRVRLEAENYSALELRKKLQFLERYMMTANVGGNNSMSKFMSRQTAVAIAAEYGRLGASAEDLTTVNLIIESLQRFESNIGGLRQSSGSEKESNVKGALGQLKSDLTRRQIQLLGAETSGDLSLEVLDEWISHIDKRVIYGALMGLVRSAASPDEVKRYLEAKIDKSYAMTERFKRSSQESGEFKSYKLRLFEAAAVRVLHLTGDLAATLDFLQENYVLLPGNKLEGTDYIFAGLLKHTLAHPEIKVERFVARMIHPETALDQVYFQTLEANESAISTVLLARLGILPTGDPSAQSFSYGIGRRLHLREELTVARAQLLYQMLDTRAITALFPSLFKNTFTLEETLQLLESRSRGNAGIWAEVRHSLTRNPRAQAHRDLQSNLKEIEGLLLSEAVLTPENIKSESAPTAPGTPAAELLDLYRSVPAVLQENLVGTLEVFEKAREITVVDPRYGTRTQRYALPALTAKTLSLIPPERRAGIYSDMIRMEAENAVRRSLPKLTEALASIEEALGEAVQEGTLNPEAEADYLAALKEYSRIGTAFSEGHITELPESFFKLRRSLQFMTVLLEVTSVSFNSKLETTAYSALQNALMRGAENLTSPRGESRQILNNFLIEDKKTVIAYLRNPESTARATRNFEIARSVAETLAYYEGLGQLSDPLNSAGLSLLSNLILTVHQPANKGVKLRILDSYRVNPPLPIQSELFTPEEVAALLPLPDGFEKLIQLEEMKFPGKNVKERYFNDFSYSLWPFRLHQSVQSENPIEALTSVLAYIKVTKTPQTNEETTRLFYTLLMRALELVRDKKDMDAFAAILATHLRSEGISISNLQEYLNADLKSLGDVSAARYREHFYDRLAHRLDEFESWRGAEETVQTRSSRVRIRALTYIFAKVDQYSKLRNNYKDPLPYRLWFLKDTVFPALVNSKWFQRFMHQLKEAIRHFYTDEMKKRGTNPGAVSPEEFMTDARSNTPWSERLDQTIADYVRSGEFEKARLQSSKRKRAVELTKQIRSLDLRSRVYADLLETYGEPSDNIFAKGLKYADLFKAYRKAEAIWTRAVIDELAQAKSLIEAWKISERAWDAHASKRASEQGVNKVEALLRLQKLKEAYVAVHSPFASEIESVFLEASRHRDHFIEKHLKARPTNFEHLKMLEDYKSRNSESPYHKIAKALFELIDEYIQRLSPVERARLALYLAGFDEELPKDLEEKVRKNFYGTRNRSAAIKRHGFYFSLADLRAFFKETHTEEKMVAFRALFIGEGGIAGNAEAERILTERLLLSDESMPPYLRKLLTIYLNVLKDTERTVLLSWLLSNSDQGYLSGPQVVDLLVGKGGVVAQKLAQIIASHGFRLPAEYQTVLERYKGKAQKVDKISAMSWISERLTEEQFRQIKTLDRELGSGSLKIAYVATLKDGRKVVIKLAREYALARTAREFEVVRSILDEVMKDPDMRIDNLPELGKEVERIVMDELRFSNEYERQGQHKAAVEARPLLVRLFGNDVSVYIPQPLPGWQSEDILVEEFVQAKSWGQLPDSALPGGWTKRKLAASSVDEILNQLLAYMNPQEHQGGGIILDIDPHEENQLAKGYGPFRKLVDIDLGQSVMVKPEVVQGIVRVLYAIYRKDGDRALEEARGYMIFRDRKDELRFKEELTKQIGLSRDPISVFTQTMEELEIEGIGLRPEYLFFQKLFATLVGLTRHLDDETYLMKQAIKIGLLRGVSHPRAGVEAVKGIVSKPKATNCEGYLL